MAVSRQPEQRPVQKGIMMGGRGPFTRWPRRSLCSPFTGSCTFPPSSLRLYVYERSMCE